MTKLILLNFIFLCVVVICFADENKSVTDVTQPIKASSEEKVIIEAGPVTKKNLKSSDLKQSESHIGILYPHHPHYHHYPYHHHGYHHHGLHHHGLHHHGLHHHGLHHHGFHHHGLHHHGLHHHGFHHHGHHHYGYHHHPYLHYHHHYPHYLHHHHHHAHYGIHPLYHPFSSIYGYSLPFYLPNSNRNNPSYLPYKNIYMNDQHTCDCKKQKTGFKTLDLIGSKTKTQFSKFDDDFDFKLPIAESHFSDKPPPSKLIKKKITENYPDLPPNELMKQLVKFDITSNLPKHSHPGFHSLVEDRYKRLIYGQFHEHYLPLNYNHPIKNLDQKIIHPSEVNKFNEPKINKKKDLENLQLPNGGEFELHTNFHDVRSNKKKVEKKKTKNEVDNFIDDQVFFDTKFQEKFEKF